MFSEQRLTQWHCLHLKVHLDCGNRATNERLSHLRLIRAVVSVIRQQDGLSVRQAAFQRANWLNFRALRQFACSRATLNRRKRKESSPSPPGQNLTVL